MKPRKLKPLLGVLLGLWLACSVSDSSGQSETSTKAVPAASPQSGEPVKPAATGKKAKQPRNPGDPTPAPKVRKAKDINFPVPVGHDANILKVPSYDQVGKLLSIVQAMKAYRVDNEHVQMDGMTFDMSPGDVNNEYKVEMPTSVLDLKTNIITSEQAVTIRTKDFELMGEKVRFDTVERTGELLGHVHMVIHNLKQVATPGQP